MAFSDDYEIVGIAADNFDCDATAGWTDTLSAAPAELSTLDPVEGTGNINLVTDGTGIGTWYHNVSSGGRFKITEKDLFFWFNYVKGKGDDYLKSTPDALVVRLYFDASYTKWADYRVAEPLGHETLKFGWQLLSCSGKNMRGGSVNSSHNNGTDWDEEITRIELVFDINASNANGAPLGMDCWFVGTKVTVTGGSEGTPNTLEDLEDWAGGIGSDRSDFPLGLVDVGDVFADVRCGLEVGDGSTAGHFAAENTFILMNQLSEEVKHEIEVNDNSTLRLGKKSVGTDGSYFVNGCQLVLPPTRYSDINVYSGGTLRLFDSKAYRWRDLFLGEATDSGTEVELRRVDFDSCETVYFRSTTLNLQDVQIHDNAANDRNQAAEMVVEPDSSAAVLVFRCNEGVHFRKSGTLTMEEYLAQDNVNYDLGILEGSTAELVNSVFSEAKLKRVT